MHDIVFSFDTTGSMYPCLAEVRRNIEATAKRLFQDIPDLRIGVIAHGDYCDDRIYVTKHLELTHDRNAVSYFVNHVEKTHGGDAPECYELVLREATTLKWRPAATKLLVLIGDDVPHPAAHTPLRIHWREEVQELTKKGVVVHGVQALNRRHATSFYEELASISGGFHLPLSQFHEVTEMLLAISYQQVSPERLETYEREVITNKRMTRGMEDVFRRLSRRDPKTGRYRKAEGTPVDYGRFQVIDVVEDMPIKELVEYNGLEFERGKGFYEFTKREKVQDYKEIIIMDRETGDMYEGGEAKSIMGLTTAGKAQKVGPTSTDKYAIFVQSTSNNRKLIGGTRFLYQVV